MLHRKSKCFLQHFTNNKPVTYCFAPNLTDLISVAPCPPKKPNLPCHK